MSSTSTTFQTEIPERLLGEARSLVDSGWFGSLDEIFADALRRFLETHRDELMERFVRDDVEWGLRGAD